MTKELAPDGAFCIEQSIQEYLDRELEAEIELTAKISELSKETRLRFLEEQTVNTLETYSEAVMFGKEIRIATANKKKSEPDYTPPDRFTTEMGVDGMVHIIRDKGTVEEAYTLVAELHNKDIISLKEVATKEHYNRTQILEETTKVVPTEISKVKGEGLMTMLDKPTTINSMFDNTYITMKVLGELDSLRSRVSELEVRQAITETKVEKIGEHLGITDTNKQVAIKLKLLGMTNKEIAKELGVVPKTITRWLKAI
jgi:hypothetical protein